MKPILWIAALWMASTLSAADVYQAVLDRSVTDSGKRVKVEIRKLTKVETETLRKDCGQKFGAVPELRDIGNREGPEYPFELKRSGESVTVDCLFKVDAGGRVEAIYRLGDASDVFFQSCARAIDKWSFADAPGPRYLRVKWSAGPRP